MKRLLLLTLVAAGCTQTAPEAPPARPPLQTELTVDSTQGCRIDDDCRAGLFCFQGQCVAECTTDAECPADTRCSSSGRCVRDAVDAGAVATLDESAIGASVSSLGAVTFTGWPLNGVVLVPDGAPFVPFTLHASAPIPEGRLLYSVTLKNGATLVSRAEGTQDFQINLPTGKAGADVPAAQVATVVVPGDSKLLFLTPAKPAGGWFAGTFSPTVFGGAGLPLEFVVQTTPERVLKLEDATEAWLWVPTTPAYVISLPGPDTQHAWVRSPLTWDAQSAAWVAVFSEPLAASRLFGDGVFPMARRSLRVELNDFEEGVWRGAVADRWKGLFDQRSADGVREAGTATLAGTFTVRRVRPVPATTDARDEVLDTGAPPQQPAPALTDCTAADFQLPPSGPDAGSPCDATQDMATFSAASAALRTQCALAMANRSLSGPTLGKTLNALLDPSTPDPSGVTFASFIEDCADAQSTTCKPTASLLCARAVTASAYLDADAASDDVQKLSTAYDALTQEAFLGRQLAAFQVDTQTRLKWLQSSEAPPFLASTLRDYNQSILATWRTQVLDAHLASVFGQLDAAGLAVLTRSPTDPEAQSNRRALLLDLTNSWRAALDGMVLLATRQNVLLQDASSRAQAAAEIRTLASRLYAAAAILQVLSREAGASALASTFGAGFSNLQGELNKLALPFDQLLFARDAEVVVSRSVDPTQNANSLLASRETAARKAVADAQASVDLVLDEAQQAAVQQADLTARYSDQILSLRNELISLCGLPEGCAAAEVGQDPACAVPTQSGFCGFVVNRDGSVLESPSTSEAGAALESLREAFVALKGAQQTRDARIQQASLLGATAQSFAAQVQKWQVQRQAVNVEINQIVSEIESINDALLETQLATMRAQQDERDADYARQQQALSAWEDIRDQGLASDIKKLHQIDALHISASVIGLAADRLDTMAGIIVDEAPEVAGPAGADPSVGLRAAVLNPAFIASTALLTAAQVFQGTATGLQTDLEADQMLREAQLTTLEQLPDLDRLTLDDELATLQGIIDRKTLTNQRAVASLQALIEARQREVQLNLAYDRDLVELRDRRDAWRMALIDANQLDYAVLQAELTTRQRTLAYAQVLQRAQLLEGRYRSMQQRFGSLQSLLGSPDVLFSFAARMASAESRIDRARTALEAWLVALEYYAVRPFVDQRLAILLARNPSQLEAIANEFLRLQRACGGPTTTQTVELSLRDDLLKMGFSTASRDDDGTLVAPDARLRALLSRGEVTTSARTPFSATQTLGERLDSGNAWAAAFPLSISGFANLGQSCNAKLSSIAVQVVGEGFTGQPVVSVVYDGAGQLRSCQPDILPLVQALGPGTTAFSAVTSFKTAGRTINPVAGLGDFGPAATWSSTLEGLPLAAGYTIVIDREHPSNKGQPWDQLQDVKLQLRYSYQDVFPEGQCQ